MCRIKLDCLIAICLVVMDIRCPFSPIRITYVMTETEEYLCNIDLNNGRVRQSSWE